MKSKKPNPTVTITIEGHDLVVENRGSQYAVFAVQEWLGKGKMRCLPVIAYPCTKEQADAAVERYRRDSSFRLVPPTIGRRAS